MYRQAERSLNYCHMDRRRPDEDGVDFLRNDNDSFPDRFGFYSHDVRHWRPFFPDGLQHLYTSIPCIIKPPIFLLFFSSFVFSLISFSFPFLFAQSCFLKICDLIYTIFSIYCAVPSYSNIKNNHITL